MAKAIIGKTYDPSQVVLTVGGLILTSWDTIAISRVEDKWSFVSGTLGESTRVKNLNNLHEFRITLQQTSADNLTLNSFFLAEATVPVTAIDKNGNSLHVMPEGTIVKDPDVEYGKDATTREWQIIGDISIPVVGGNN